MQVQGSEKRIGKQKEGLEPIRTDIGARAKSEGQFRLNEAVIGELVVLASATVPPVKDMMKCRPNIELGLKIGDVCKTQVHTIWQEKILGEKLVELPSNSGWD